MRFKLPDLRDPDTKFRMTLYAGAFAISMLLFISVVFPLASNSTFCGKACHNMAPEWESWKRSSHAQVTCYGCHVDQTLPALFKEKLTSGPKGMFNTAFNRYERPINPHGHYSQNLLPMARCQRCHAMENRKFTFTRGIYMNHEAHKAAGIDCAVCHNRVAHNGAEDFEPLKSWPEGKKLAAEEGEKEFRYKNFLTMKEGCLRCHSGSPGSRNPETLALIENGKTPPTDCATCHTSDFELPKGHRDASWRSGHGEVAKSNFAYCFTCHGAGAKFDNGGKPWCTRCHDAEKVGTFKLT